LLLLPCTKEESSMPGGKKGETTQEKIQKGNRKKHSSPSKITPNAYERGSLVLPGGTLWGKDEKGESLRAVSQTKGNSL